MSVRTLTKIWETSTRKGGELLVLLAIGDFADDSGKAYPSIATLSKKARLSERQTQRAISTLQRAGELTIAPGFGPWGTHLYQVTCCGGDILSGGVTSTVNKGDSLPPGGVTSCREGGDAHVTGGVTSMSPNPSEEPNQEGRRGDPAQLDRPSPPRGTTPSPIGPVLADAEFLNALKINPAYTGIDIDRLYGRLQAWQMTPQGRGKLITRKRFLNCLNREERAMTLPATTPQCAWTKLGKRCEANANSESKYCGPHQEEIRRQRERVAELEQGAARREAVGVA